VGLKCLKIDNFFWKPRGLYSKNSLGEFNMTACLYLNINMTNHVMLLENSTSLLAYGDRNEDRATLGEKHKA
jgi:hypothetical protein